MASLLDLLFNRNDDTYKPDDYQDRPDSDDKNNPPQGGRSELMGRLMSGIPATNGYPITDENMAAKPQAPAAPINTPAPTPQAPAAKVTQPFQGVDASKALQGSDDVIAAAKAAKPTDDEPSDEMPQPKDMPAASDADAQQAPEAPKSALEQYIQQLKDAQQKQQDTLTGLNRTEGIAQLLGGLARAPVQGGFLDDQRKQAALPVQNVQQNVGLQEAITQDQNNKQSMALRQKAAEQEAQMNSMKLEQLTSSLNDEKALRDPNSDASAALRSFQKGRLGQLNQATGKQLFDPNVVDTMSGEQIEKAFGKSTPEQVADTFIKSQASRDNAAASRDMKQIAMQGVNDRHEESMQWRNDQNDIRKDNQDRNEHKQVLNNLVKDKNLNKYVANYGNLNQVLTKINDPNVQVTPQILHDMQNLLVQSMGNISAGGVDERRNRDMVNGAGIDWAKFKGYMTSKPEEVSPQIQKDMFNQFSNLLNNEQVTTAAVVKPILDRLSAGHRSMYERRPDLQSDLKDALDTNNNLFQNHIQMPANMTGRATAPQQGTPQQTQQSAPPPPTNNKVRVSNGSQTFDIDPADLDAAKKDGYKVMQ